MAAIANDKFNDTVYNFVSGASLYAYISHYFFIVIIAVGIIRPYSIPFIPALFIMIFGTFFLIMATYIPLNLLYECIVPPQPSVKLELKEDLLEDDEKKSLLKNEGKAKDLENK